MEDDTKKRLQSLLEEIDRRYDRAHEAMEDAHRTMDAWRSSCSVARFRENGHAELEWNLNRLKELGLISQDEYDEATTLRRRIYRRAHLVSLITVDGSLL